MKRLLWVFLIGFTAIAHGQISRVSFGPQVALPAGDSPIQCAVQDIDGDGRADLVVANHLNSRLTVYRNVGTGGAISASTFAAPLTFVTGSMPHDMALGDIDGDGLVDVVTGNFGDHTVSLIRNTSVPGTIQFGARIDIPAGGSLPRSVTLADVDSDDRLDLLVACHDSDSVSFFRNMGGGVSTNTFPRPAVLPIGDGPHTIVAGDLTGDGRPEILVANFQTPDLAILRHVPGATAEVAPFRTNNFVELMRLPRGGNALHLGDIDGDGQADVAVGHWRTRMLAIFRQSDPGGALLRFDELAELSVGHSIQSLVVRDLDDDDRPDLVTVGELSSYMSVFRNIGSRGAIVPGSFAARVDFLSGWNANGLAVGDVQGDGQPDIVFANAYDDNIFIYENRIGDTNVLEPPMFIEQPQSQTVEAGGRVTFTFGVTGTEPFTFRWRRNGVTIPNSDTDTFTIHNVQPSDAGVYTVVAMNPANPSPGVISAPATLTVIGTNVVQPPRFVVQPQSQTVPEGGTAMFHVEVSGTPPFGYRWRRNGVNVTGFGQGTDTLIIPNVQASHAGVYSVVVTNAANPAPGILSSNAVLVVAPTNAPPPPLVGINQTWRYDQSGADLTPAFVARDFDDSNWPQGAAPLGVEFAQLPTPINTPLTLGQVTYYFRTALNLTAAQLNSISQFYVNTLIDDGAVVYVNGAEILRLRMPDGPVTGNTFAQGVVGDAMLEGPFEIPSDQFVAGENIIAVEVHQANLASSDIVFGMTLNGVGVVNTNLPPPIITEQPQSQTVAVGGTTTFQVEATGAGPLAYRWRRNGVTIPTANTDTLTLSNAQPSDAGVYTVIVSNVGSPAPGVISAPATLTVIDEPPPPPGNAPVITRIHPTSGPVGTELAIEGSALTNGITHVRVGGIVASVMSANATRLVVRVPVGAMYAPVTVTANGRTAYSRERFNVTFRAAERIRSAYFGPRVDLACGPIPIHMAGGDMDGDGYTDLVVANRDGANFTVFRNRGAAGGFHPGVHFSAGNTPYQLAIADMNGDGRLDVVTADANSNTASVHRNTSSPGSVSFATRVANAVGRRPISVAVGDLNRDGFVDVVTGDYDDHAISVLLGADGTGALLPRVTYATGGDTHALAIADVTGDGYADVVGANYLSGSVALLRGTAAGTLAPRQLFAGGGNTITLANVDLDDDLDLVVGNYRGSEVRVFDNVGFHTTNQFFSPTSFPAGTTPHQVAVGDLDGDGQTDIAAAGESLSRIGLLQNGSTWGLGTVFGPPELLVAQANETGIVLADFDLDGRPDVAVANAYSSTISWFRNNIPETEPPVEPPQITRQPQSQTVPWEGTAVFSVEATGTPPLGYVWRHNNIMVPNSNTNRLVISNVQPGQAGNYWVQVTNAAGSVVSDTVTLTVTGTNQIPPGNLISLGQVWRYEASGTDLGTAWRDPNTNDAAWPSGPGLLGFESGPLPAPIQTVLPIGPITYYFRTEVNLNVPVIDPFAQFRLRTLVDDGAVVYINGMEAVRVGMPAGDITYNTLATRSAEAIFEGPFTIPPRFFVPGRNVIAVEVHQGQVASGDVVFGLALEGQPGGTNVVRPPVITQHPQSQTVEVGGTAIFRVEVSGTPPFGYRWRRNGVTVVPFGQGGPALVISNVQPAHAGVYNVIVTNAASMVGVLSSNAVLTVINPTNVIPLRITQQPQSQTVPAGGTATFEVQAIGTGLLRYQWFKDGAQLGGATNRMLTMTNVQTNHAGVYMVSLTDAVGTIMSQPATLTVGPSVPAPQPPVITSFTPSSGPTGTVVTINGRNFAAAVGVNRVHFGAVRARVLTASATQLTVQVPVGATYEPISVNTSNRVAFSDLPFVVTFESSRAIHRHSFSGFNLPAGDSPVHVSMGDMEGNGKVDFVAANHYSSTVGVYLNQNENDVMEATDFGPGRTHPTGSLPFHMALADLDGVGGLDIITANPGDHTISLLRNTPAGVFALSPPVNFSVGRLPIAVATGDLDKDGRVDIVVANHDSDSITILRQVGNPFTTVATAPFQMVEIPIGDGPHNIVIGDIDGDSRPEIIVANYQTPTMAVLRNLTTGPGIGTGSFAPAVQFPRGGNCMAYGDLDGDGRGDIALGNWRTQTLSLFRNVSSRGAIGLDSLAAPVDFPMGNNPHTIVLSDLDGDSRVDIALVGELPSYMSIFRNVSSAGALSRSSFEPRVDFPSGWNAIGVAAGDLDGDGRPELVFANAYDDNLTVYRNQTDEAAPNEPPIARASAGPAVEFLSEGDRYAIIAPLGGGTMACLNGGDSEDPDGDDLAFEWLIGGEVIAREASISRRLALGTHVVTLRVSDGTETDTTSITVEVITPADAVGSLIELVEASDLPPRVKQRVIAILEDTVSIIVHDPRRADTRLEKAQRRIRLLLGREDPALANLVIDALQQIIQCSRCD
jgi:hypothetical protein